MSNIVSINKPLFDQRIFKGGILKNGIKFILINDEHLEKSFVSVCLKVGSFNNPKSYDGIAHFLEHMLFMGSKKYPNENHYYTRLNELGGGSNAYTDIMETVYYFNVFDNGLEEIIDIFSRFFIDPLFDIDSVSREINAVDNEHKKNLNKDNWIKFQLLLYLSNLNSPINTFITGSLNTLNKIDIREKMIEFYENFYNPDNISVCISSSKSINELYDIINKTFGNISNDRKSKNLTIIKPFYSENINKTYHLKSISNIYEISYLWEIPKQDLFLESKDFSILDFFLSNSSVNSLTFYLNNLGYLKNLYCEVKYEGIFYITLNLTSEGFNNINFIESCLNKAIQDFINSNIEEYARYFQKVNLINFNTMKKTDTEILCNLLSVNHHYYDTKSVFESSYLIKEIKSNEDYKKIFTDYLKSNNCLKIISSQNLDNFELINMNYINVKEYQTSYCEIPNINYDVLIDKNFNNNDFTNNYLDINLNDLLNKNILKESNDIPILIENRQWLGECSKFGEPMIYIWLQMNNNKYYDNSTNYILTKISCSILNYLVSVILYKPFEINYNITFEPNTLTSSINIEINALNNIEKLKELIEELENFIFNIEQNFVLLSDNYIENLILSFKESYYNINYLNSWEYSSFFVKNIVFDTEFSPNDIINSLQKINHLEIKNYIKDIFNNSALTSLIYGNLDYNKFNKILSKFSKFFKTNMYQLPLTKQLLNTTINHPNINETSNCVSYYYYIGKFNPKDFILLNLSINILAQSFFDKLRTKHQLGYLVKMGISNFRDDYYIIQKIQSNKPIHFIEDKINKFNNKIKNIISLSDFNNFIETFKNQLNEPDNTLEEKFYRYKPEISLRQFLFNRNQILLDYLPKISKSDIIDFSTQFINDSNKIKIIINSNLT